MKFIIQNKYLSECLHLIFPNKVEIKDKTETRRSDTYLYVSSTLTQMNDFKLESLTNEIFSTFQFQRQGLFLDFFLTFLIYRMN